MDELIASGKVEKIYIPDTSVFIHHPVCLDVLGSRGNLVKVPFSVILQIDHLKTRQDLKGAAAREASRQIKSYRKKGLETGGSLRGGVQTKNGGWVAVDYFARQDAANLGDLPPDFDPKNTPDDQIIFSALQSSRKYPAIPNILVSQDTNMLLKADILGLTAEDYEHDTVLTSLSDLYTGMADIVVADYATAAFIQALYEKGSVHEALAFKSVGEKNLMPNQCCRFIGPNGEVAALAIYKKAARLFRRVESAKEYKKKAAKSIVPLNDEQAFAYALLTDPKILLVTLAGPGGVGKTLLTLSAGANQIDAHYETGILVFRPIVEVGGRTLGYHKGTLEEKFEPWTGAILDNLEYVEMSLPKGVAKDLRKDKLTMAPLIHTRGRSIHNKFIYVDDAQNLTPHEAKTIATRPAGESKLVLGGDPEQVDDPFLTSISNGLVYVIQRMKGSEVFGHIILKEPVRGELTKATAERL